MPSRRERANAIRALSMDAVQKANSGHPGAPMGMADIAEVLWRDYLKHNPANPLFADRDRFILSNGHGSMLIYSLLHLTGYDLSIDDLKNFRQLHSRTPGHPEYGYTPGVETTTGPLGQGFANAVGFAVAEKTLAAQFNRPGHDIVARHFRRTETVIVEQEKRRDQAGPARAVPDRVRILGGVDAERAGLRDDRPVLGFPAQGQGGRLIAGPFVRRRCGRPKIMIARRPDHPREFLPRHREAFADQIDALGNIAGDDQPVLRMGLQRRKGCAVDRVGEMQDGNGEQTHDRTIGSAAGRFPIR